MALVMFALSATVYEIIGVKKMYDLDLDLQWVKVKCKYTNRKQILDSLCISNNNVCPIGHRLRNIHSQNLRDLDL